MPWNSGKDHWKIITWNNCVKKTFTSILKTCFRNILVPETCRACLHRLCRPPYPIQLAEAASAGCWTSQDQGDHGHKTWSCSSAGASGQGWLQECVRGTVCSGSTGKPVTAGRETAAWLGVPSSTATVDASCLASRDMVKGRGEESRGHL